MTDKCSQQRLEVTLLRQAPLHLRLPTDGFRVKQEQQEEGLDLMLSAAG